MTTRLTVLTLALMAVAGVAQAQSRPVLITNGPQASPGDYTREKPGLQPPDSRSVAMSPARSNAQHATVFKDEYGFRYDERGDRINAAGRRISPHTMKP